MPLSMHFSCTTFNNLKGKADVRPLWRDHYNCYQSTIVRLPLYVQTIVRGQSM